jgi:hypothetical protein
MFELKTATPIFQWLVRLTGTLQIVLGMPIWTGNADALIGIHIVSGVALVLSLVALAVLAAAARVQPSLVALAIVWAVVVLALGLAQAQLLLGPYHWVIQVAHTLIGLGAIGQAENLARRIKGGRTLSAAA